MDGSIFRRALNVIFAIGQALIPALGYAGLFGRAVDSQAQTIKTPVVPADYAFAIWSVIFAFCLIYAFQQARPSRSDDALFRRIGWATAAAFAANTVWSILAQLEYPLIWTGMVFLVAFVAMMFAVRRVAIDRPWPRERWAVHVPIGLLAGWVSVAIFANWSVVLADLGLAEQGGETLQGLAFLSGAGLVAAWTIRDTKAQPPYCAAVAWALIALIIANLERGNIVVAGGAAAWLAVLAILAWRCSTSEVAGRAGSAPA